VYYFYVTLAYGDKAVTHLCSYRLKEFDRIKIERLADLQPK